MFTDHFGAHGPLPVEDMYKAIGDGLREFGNIEATLSMIFIEMLKPADYRKSFAVFESMRHIETRTRVLRAVAEESLKDESDLLETFKKLLKCLDRRSAMRNKLAHWVPVYWSPPGQILAINVTVHQDCEVRLVPAPIAGNLMDAGNQTLTLHVVQSFANNCNSLYLEFMEFFVKFKRTTGKN